MQTRAALALCLLASSAAIAQAQVAGYPVYSLFEQKVEAAQTYSDPLRDVSVEVRFTSPLGRTYLVPAFWTGGTTWQVRFSPEEKGDWKYQWVTPDRGLAKNKGKFRVVAARGDFRGAPRLSSNRRYFTDAAGRPWFWLSDTAWNGALKATREEWDEYLSARAKQRYTAVQFVMTQWRAGRTDENGKVAFGFVNNQLVIDPAFFDRMDERITAINRHGLVAAPVLLWALTSKDKESPGEILTTDQAISLARYMVARYNAYNVMWILGGDGDYRGDKAEHWKQIGRAVFPPNFPRRVVTLHPRGMQSPWPGLKDEPWVDFFMYQSGHGDDARKWKWQVTEGGARDWPLTPPRPVIDGEPNYEGHVSYQSKQQVNDYAVRRAAYYSLLAAPVAGVSYGAHGIWFWSRKAEVPLDHPGTGVALPWRECLTYPGAAQMKIMRDLFDKIDWWKLRPDPSILAENKTDEAFSNFTVAARAEDSSFLLIYTPVTQPIKLNPTALPHDPRAEWWDPFSGEAHPVEAKETMTPPSDGDWLLRITKGN